MTERPSAAEIRGLLKMLGIDAESLVRKKEKLYKEKFKDRKLTNKQWIDTLARHPELIERPIVVMGKKAIIGRPAATVVDFVRPGKTTGTR